MKNEIDIAASLIKESSYTTAFTGAGISVESGIPPFRGKNGLWNKYDPNMLVLDYFLKNPAESWKVIKEIFYDFFDKSEPNVAHKVLFEMEEQGLLKSIITQNIDNLHQFAGNKTVFEFHGNSHKLVCLKTGNTYKFDEVYLEEMPPKSEYGGILKPDFIFFGESIPEGAYNNSLDAAQKSEVMLVIGTTGEVMPACKMPIIAKDNGAKIIEINTEKTTYTSSITDIFLRGKAGEIMSQLGQLIFS